MPKKTKQQKAVDDNAILDRLERIVRWADEFRLGFVKCNHPTQCEAMRRALLDRLKDKGVLEVFLERPIISLLDEITVRWDNVNPPDAVCVYGLEKSIQEKREESPVLGRLNHDRDLIRRAVPAALLIWLPDFALDCVVRGAPDFWAWRSGVYEFATDTTLWQMDSAAALDSDVPALLSLTLEDKQKEIARLEELLRTARALPKQGKREQETVARLLYQLGLLHYSLGEWDTARARFEESLATFQQIGNQRGIAGTLHQLASIAHLQGKLAEARRLYNESLEIKNKLGDQIGIAGALHQLGVLAQSQGDLAEAQRLYEESLEIAKKLDYQRGIANTLHQLGNIVYIQNDLAKARRLYSESLEIKRKLGDQIGIAGTLYQLGILAQDQGNLAEARRLYNESLEIAKKLGDLRGIALTLGELGLLMEKEGNKVEAARLLREALSIFEKLKSPNTEIVRRSLERVEGKSLIITE